jgi:hypothetical protein
MAWIVFVTWYGGGNLAPALGIGSELGRRGHTVSAFGQAPQRMISADADASQLRDAAAQVLAKASYRQAARWLASALARADGAATAASVLEPRPSIAGDPKIRRTGCSGREGLHVAITQVGIPIRHHTTEACDCESRPVTGGGDQVSGRTATLSRDRRCRVVQAAGPARLWRAHQARTPLSGRRLARRAWRSSGEVIR